MGNSDGGDGLWVALGIAGTGVPTRAAGTASAAPSRGPAVVAGHGGFRCELLQQYRDPVSDSAAAFRGPRDDDWVERRVPTPGRGSVGGISLSLLDAHRSPLFRLRRLSDGHTS